MALEGTVPVWMQTPPMLVAAVDDGDAAAELGGAEGRLLPGGAAAEDDQIVRGVRAGGLRRGLHHPWHRPIGGTGIAGRWQQLRSTFYRNDK